jgi:ATP-dependent Clp protease ATP-binding subunit ClpA
MFERFSPAARATVKRATRIAAEDGTPTVEAEHLLLALTRQANDRTARALHALGVTEGTVRAALAHEYRDALQAVGVTTAVRPRPPSRPARSTPRWGQSAKLALVRTLQVALDRGHKSLDDHDILLALTRAEAGVIPRVLRTLDVAPSDIETALR